MADAGARSEVALNQSGPPTVAQKQAAKRLRRMRRVHDRPVHPGAVYQADYTPPGQLTPTSPGTYAFGPLKTPSFRLASISPAVTCKNSAAAPRSPR